MAFQFLRAPSTYLKHGSNHLVHPSSQSSSSRLTATGSSRGTGDSERNMSIMEYGAGSAEEHSEGGTGAIRCVLCPACILPLVVAFIMIFTVVQLIIIHRTIETYKMRDQAYKDCYYPSTHQHQQQHPCGEYALVQQHQHPDNEPVPDDSPHLRQQQQKQEDATRSMAMAMTTTTTSSEDEYDDEEEFRLLNSNTIPMANVHRIGANSHVNRTATVHTKWT